MKKTIRVRDYGAIHYHAACNECEFSAAIHTKETSKATDVRNAVRSHVRKTGHTVWIESGKHIDYSLEQTK